MSAEVEGGHPKNQWRGVQKLLGSCGNTGGMRINWAWNKGKGHEVL